MIRPRTPREWFLVGVAVGILMSCSINVVTVVFS